MGNILWSQRELQRASCLISSSLRARIFRWLTRDGYTLKEVKGPGGFESRIYIVAEKYIYSIIYGTPDENMIHAVPEDFEVEVLEILDTWEFTSP
ncbi:hypothetical protein ACFL0L_02605 [Patescibacteria group bacterium]